MKRWFKEWWPAVATGILLIIFGLFTGLKHQQKKHQKDLEHCECELAELQDYCDGFVGACIEMLAECRAELKQ